MLELEKSKSYLNNKIYSPHVINRMIRIKDIDLFATLENNNKILRIFNINSFKEYKLQSLNFNFDSNKKAYHIIDIIYIKKYSLLVITTSDSFLTFVDIKTDSIKNKFLVPEI